MKDKMKLKDISILEFNIDGDDINDLALLLRYGCKILNYTNLDDKTILMFIENKTEKSLHKTVLHTVTDFNITGISFTK